MRVFYPVFPRDGIINAAIAGAPLAVFEDLAAKTDLGSPVLSTVLAQESIRNLLIPCQIFLIKISIETQFSY
jgi:hypothetical protein